MANDQLSSQFSNLTFLKIVTNSKFEQIKWRIKITAFFSRSSYNVYLSRNFISTLSKKVPWEWSHFERTIFHTELWNRVHRWDVGQIWRASSVYISTYSPWVQILILAYLFIPTEGLFSHIRGTSLVQLPGNKEVGLGTNLSISWRFESYHLQIWVLINNSYVPVVE